MPLDVVGIALSLDWVTNKGSAHIHVTTYGKAEVLLCLRVP